VRFSEAKVRGVSGNQSVSSIDPRTFTDLYKLDMKAGGEAAVRDLGPGDVLVKKGYADSHDTKLGDTLQVTTPIGKRIAPKVIGIVDDKGGLLANLTVTNAIAQTPSVSSAPIRAPTWRWSSSRSSSCSTPATPRPRS
jgi:hypothetical protein